MQAGMHLRCLTNGVSHKSSFIEPPGFVLRPKNKADLCAILGAALIFSIVKLISLTF